jgi:hypothetical protein
LLIVLANLRAPIQQANTQQPNVQPTAATQAGVLIAYAFPSAHNKVEYQTNWIVFSPSEAYVAATAPDIVVPRSTGFWRLGTTIACEYSVENQQDASREIVWQSPVEKTPVFNQGPPCKNHKTAFVDELPDEENAGPSDSHGAQVPLCSVETAEILFVSPTHVSEYFNDYDRCDARGGHDLTDEDVRPLDNFAPISLADLLGDSAAKSYRLAAQKGFAENSKEYNCPEPDPERFDLKSWRISHRHGTWTPYASLTQYMGECTYFYQTDLTLPKSVTGEAAQARLWKSFAAAVPHVEDFFLSPLGDYALILVSAKTNDHHLYAYSIQNGVPAKRLAEIPWDIGNSHHVVMAQWSSAKYIPQWTSAIKKIQDHPLPDAVPHPAPISSLKFLHDSHPPAHGSHPDVESSWALGIDSAENVVKGGAIEFSLQIIASLPALMRGSSTL